jgi:hypothetical protein
MIRDSFRRLSRRIGRAIERRPWLGGATGGFVATVSMSAFREPVSRSLPPTSGFCARVTGDDPGDHPVAAYLLHLLYGVGAGTVFGPLVARTPSRVTGSVKGNIALGAVYGALLSVVGRRFVLPAVAGVELDPEEAAIFDAGHLVYGLALGAWVGTRETPRGRQIRDAFERTAPEGA